MSDSENTIEVHPADKQLYRLLADNAREMISRHTTDLSFLYASPAAERVIGFPADKLVGQRLDDLVHPDDLSGVVSTFALAVEGNETVVTTMRLKTPDDGWRWCEAFCRGVTVAEDGRKEIHVATHDISKFKHIEQAIERVAKEWRSTFDAASDAILVLDKESRIVRVNLATIHLFECEFSDVLGERINDVARLRLGLNDPFGVDECRINVTQIRHDVAISDGERWLRSTLDPILDANDTITGAILFLADISSEKKAEARLRDSLDQVRSLTAHLQNVRDEERAAIAREVHDELGHALTALKMDIAWLKRQNGVDDKLLERADGMSRLIDQTISMVRRICTSLRPQVLDDLGLDAALEWLAEDFRERTSIPTVLHLPESPESIRNHRGTAIFRVVQEALTNIARHADASRVDIEWQQDDDRVWLTIDDDGQNFTPAAPAPGSGFGLLGMYERARQLGGELDLDVNPGKGTRVQLTIPRRQST